MFTKKILFISLACLGTLILLSVLVITLFPKSTPTVVQQNCDIECLARIRLLTLEKNLAATVQIVLDKSVPVIDYNQETYPDNSNSDKETLVQQVVFGVDESGYVLEYGVEMQQGVSSPSVQPKYLSLTVKYKVTDIDISMSFLDYEVDGEVDEVYINDTLITEKEALKDVQSRYETELQTTASYYFGTQQKS